MKVRHLIAAAAMATLVAVPAASMAQRGRVVRPPLNQRSQRPEHSVERLVNQAERSSNQFRALVERQWDSRRERDWNRGWDNEWSRGRQGGWGNGDNRGGQGGWNNGSYRGGQNRDQDWDRNSRYTRRYGPKESVQRLDEALERLRHAVNRDRRDNNWQDYRVGRDEMMEVVRAADNVDFYFGRNRGHNSSLDRQWANVKRDIEALERFYNVRNYNRW